MIQFQLFKQTKNELMYIFMVGSGFPSINHKKNERHFKLNDLMINNKKLQKGLIGQRIN